MSYNYLTLVNDINRRLNEVELTQTNFTGATGYYSFAKDSINSAIRHIQQEAYEWPWNHVEASEVLNPNTARYSIPYDAKTVSMNTFRIKRDDALSVGTIKLKVLDYEEYLDKFADSEYNSSSSIPRYVARTPSRELIFYPKPDQAYEVIYEYFTNGFDLEKPLDVPNLPEQYRYIITDGAMYYVYQFRGDTQSAQLAIQKFTQGIKQLRSLHINRTEYLRDTRVYY
jgi:hypothetical protein|tara:strand:+ start:535 stop:1215 length:681 start_codon:yes stop_codon:yes gene_type:complete